MFLLILKIALALIMTTLPFLIGPYIKSSQDNSKSKSNLYTYASYTLDKIPRWRKAHKHIDPIRKLYYLHITLAKKLQREHFIK